MGSTRGHEGSEAHPKALVSQGPQGNTSSRKWHLRGVRAPPSPIPPYHIYPYRIVTCEGLTKSDKSIA